MDDGGRINAAAVGAAGLAVPLLPPGSDIMIDESPAPLLPLLGPMAASAADAEAAALSGFQRALPPHHQHQHQQQRCKKPMHWAVAGLILFGFSAPAALVTVKPTDSFLGFQHRPPSFNWG